MDYSTIVDTHRRHRADLTVGVMEVPLEETDRFGIMTTDASDRIVEFTEKPKNRDKGTLASMGIYVFSADALIQRLSEGSDDKPRIDFGKNVIPAMVAEDTVVAYRFDGYWVDVGTIQSYWETSMQLLDQELNFDLYDPSWVIRTRSEERPPAKIGPQSRVVNSIVCNGCTVRGAVERSVLSPGVYVSPGAIVRDSVVMNDTWIGPGAVLDRVIVDKDVVVGAGARLGVGDDLTLPNKLQPDKLNTGVSVIGKSAHIPPGISVGRNVVVNADRDAEDFPGRDVASGETI
jgi:glucose-1-phosphate adenylyltransferase